MKNSTLPLSYTLRQPEDTLKLAASLSTLCYKQCVLFLTGPLGVGKTTFARGFIQNLAGEQSVKSPTYTLLESYPTAIGIILHFDLYRLKTECELENIGIRDYTAKPAIWLVEWPFNTQLSLLPKPDILLSFSFVEDAHQIIFKPRTLEGTKMVEQLSKRHPALAC